MFDIGWSELLVIAVVAIVVVGPKDLPRLMRTFGTYAGKLRRMAADFQRQFDEAVRESELDEVRKSLESIRTSTPSLDLNAPIDRPLMLPKVEPEGASASAPPTGKALRPKRAVAKPKAPPKQESAAKPKAAAKQEAAAKPEAAAKKPRKARPQAERKP